MSNTYRTEILDITTGEWIAGPTVQGRATTARTAAQKAAQWYSAQTGKSITNDRSGGSSIGNMARGGGLALRVMTQNYYGFALVQGYYPTAVTSGADDIAIAESVILHSSTDGACDGGGAGSTTTASFGTASEADVNADNSVALFVNFL